MEKGCGNYTDQACSELIANPVLVEEIDGYTIVERRSENWEGILVEEIEYEKEVQGSSDEEIIVYVGHLPDTNAEMKNNPLFKYELLEENFWTVRQYWDESNNEIQYYVIGDEERYALWVNKNMFVIIGEEGRYNDDSEVTFADIIEKMKDNTYERIGGEIENPTTHTLIHTYMKSCPSTVDVSCYPSWQRKIEPAICPPHGYQTEIIRDTNYCSSQKRDQRIQCSPGICSGCFVPRWSGARDNVCIPYGTRLMFEKGDDFTIYNNEFVEEFEEEGFNVEISENSIYVEMMKDYEEDDVSITVNGQIFNLKQGESFTAYEGGTYNLVIRDGDYEEEYSITIDDIHYSENPEEIYLKFTVNDKYAAYCNYNGEMQKQKTVDYQGNWASCQNNYECESNICSSGECIEVANAIRQSKGLRSFFIKVMCKLGNLFDLEEYEQCLAEYLN